MFYIYVKKLRHVLYNVTCCTLHNMIAINNHMTARINFYLKLRFENLMACS